MTPAESDPIHAVLQAERDWLQAHLKADSSRLAQLAADEYQQVSSDGTLISKNELLASFASGTRHWVAAESDEHSVRFYGSVALVVGRWRAKGVNARHPFDYAARYVAVWVHRNGHWQLASDQSTTIPHARSGF